MKTILPHIALAPQFAALLKLATPAAFVAQQRAMPLPSTADEITNWEGGVTYRPAVVVRPRTIDDVVRVVSDAVSYPSPVRAVGKLHSPAPCSADVGGTMLDMTGMTRILEIGHDFVTAEAGALYIDVAEELARHDKQFHINTEIGNVTLGAVACAATKDSSLIGTSHWGQVSSFVSGLKIVKPDGTVASYDETDHPGAMRLLRSSYGLLGVLVEVTLRIKPTTAVYARHRTYTIDAFRAAMPELIAQGNALMMYFYPFCEKVMVEERRELPGVKPTSSGRWWLRNAFWRHLGPWFTIMIARGCARQRRRASPAFGLRSLDPPMDVHARRRQVDDAAPADHPAPGEARAVQVRLLHVVVRRGTVLRRLRRLLPVLPRLRAAHRVPLRSAGGRLSHGAGQERAAVLHL